MPLNVQKGSYNRLRLNSERLLTLSPKLAFVDISSRHPPGPVQPFRDRRYLDKYIPTGFPTSPRLALANRSDRSIAGLQIEQPSMAGVFDMVTVCPIDPYPSSGFLDYGKVWRTGRNLRGEDGPLSESRDHSIGQEPRAGP